MVEDVFSDRFSLLMPCPNALRHSGENMSSYVPNPKHTSPRAMEMLVFLGRLMGLSLRHKSSLPFYFPSIVWKPLVGVPLAAEDLYQVHRDEQSKQEWSWRDDRIPCCVVCLSGWLADVCDGSRTGVVAGG